MKYSILSAINDVSSLTRPQLEQTFAVAASNRSASATAIVESIGHYAPTDEDYRQWLDVMHGFAEENGIDIRRRAAFLDLAHMMWDDDPVPPPDHVRTRLANTLWAIDKANRERARVNKHLSGEDQSRGISPSKQPVATTNSVDHQENEEATDPLSPALTASKHELDARIRQYEQDGERAFANTQWVDNPHPHNSLAWKAWNKGYRQKLIDHFNIKVAPPEPTRGSGKKKR